MNILRSNWWLTRVDIDPAYASSHHRNGIIFDSYRCGLLKRTRTHVPTIRLRKYANCTKSNPEWHWLRNNNRNTKNSIVIGAEMWNTVRLNVHWILDSFKLDSWFRTCARDRRSSLIYITHSNETCQQQTYASSEFALERTKRQQKTNEKYNLKKKAKSKVFAWNYLRVDRSFRFHSAQCDVFYMSFIDLSRSVSVPLLFEIGQRSADRWFSRHRRNYVRREWLHKWHKFKFSSLDFLFPIARDFFGNFST